MQHKTDMPHGYAVTASILEWWQMFFSLCFLLINPSILLSLSSTSKLSALNSVNRVYKLVTVSTFHSMWKAICMDTAGFTTPLRNRAVGRYKTQSFLLSLSMSSPSQGNPQARHLQLPSHRFLCRGSVEGAAVGTAAHRPKLLLQQDPRMAPIRKKVASPKACSRWTSATENATFAHCWEWGLFYLKRQQWCVLQNAPHRGCGWSAQVQLHENPQKFLFSSTLYMAKWKSPSK